MSQKHTGNIQPQLDLEEHVGLADAKRVVIVGNDGSGYVEMKVNADGSINGGGGGGGGSVTQGTVPWVIQEPLSVDDNGASLTVDGTVAITGTVDVTGSTVTIQEPLSIDDNGGSITVDGTVSATQGTSPWVVSGTVAVSNQNTQYTEGDVDVSITGTAAMGEAPSSTLFPLQLDNNGSLKVVPGSGAQFSTNDAADLLDNAAFSDGVSYVQAVGYILDETPGTALTENDAAAARIDSKRAQICTIEDETTRGRRATVTAANALKVDGSAVTQPVSATQTTSPWVTADNQTIVDNAGFTDGTSKVLMAGFVFDDTAGTALTENDAAAARVDSKRALVSVIEDATTRGQKAAVSAGGALSVDTELPAAAALAAGQANPTTPTVGGASLEHTGTAAATTWDPVYHSFFDSKTGVTNASGAGTTVDMSTCPMSKFAIDVEFQSGTVTSYNIDLQGSLNGSTWYQIGNTTAAAGGNTLTFFVDKPVRYMRHFVNAIVGASGTVRVRILACGR